MRTLVVTNDFPPRQGGIQTFVAALLARRPPESLVVLASRSPGSEAHDAALPYEVVRHPTGMLLPTPGGARAAAGLARRHRCDTAFFGAAAPWACSRRRCGTPGCGTWSAPPTATRPAGWHCPARGSSCGGSPPGSTC